MNTKCVFAQGISAAAVLLAVAGCSVPTITVECKMPPRAISDIKGIDVMEIVVNTSLTGNRIAPGDDSIAKAAVCERLAGKIGSEGFYRTTDFIWGNPDGADKMFSLLDAKKSRHGYARIATNPVRPRARLELNLEADVTAKAFDKTIDTKLTTVYYSTQYRRETIYWGTGENKHRETINVPYSVPARTTTSVAQSQAGEYGLFARGRLTAKLTDKNGKVVYRKTHSLAFRSVCNEANLAAPPTNAEVFSALTGDAIVSIMKDLSPYKESRDIKINKDGSKRGFYLLEALALSEAATAYEAIEEKKRTFADWENYGIVCEALGDISGARRCFETAVKLKKTDKGFFDYDKNIAEDGLVRLEQTVADQERLDRMSRKK